VLKTIYCRAVGGSGRDKGFDRKFHPANVTRQRPNLAQNMSDLEGSVGQTHPRHKRIGPQLGHFFT